jgi:RNA polymerase sigma-70 factor (ECF subfamily)
VDFFLGCGNFPATMTVSPNDRSKERTRLMREAQKGHRTSYDALLRETVPMLKGYFRKRLNGEESEDLVQQCLLRLHLYRASCAEAFDPWVFTIAKHVLFDHLKKKKCVEEAPEETAPARQEIALALEGALADLSEENRQAVLLTKYQGLEVGEAAIQEGVSESALKVRVHRAMKILRENLWID